MASTNIEKATARFKNALADCYNKNEINSFINIIFDHLFSWQPAYFHSHPETEIAEDKEAELEEIIRQLKKQKPIQYILKKTTFYDLEFLVNPDVLIPRPETEELVNLIIKHSKNKKELSIIDIGTGSGCIGISLAKNLPFSKVDLTDISDKALLTAVKNAKHNTANTQFFLFDILHFENITLDKQYDIIVSNPPYVRESEKKLMKKNVLDYEPYQALFVKDDDPLIFYKAIARFGLKYLNPEGNMFLEINEALGKDILSLFRKMNYGELEIHKDLNGKDRILHAKKLVI